MAINKLVGTDGSITINIKSLSGYLISSCGDQQVETGQVVLDETEERLYIFILFCSYLPQITYEYF